MDFKTLKGVTTPEARAKVIETEIDDGDWQDYLTELPHGGWAEDILASIEIDESDDEEIVVEVGLEFSETCASSCADINPYYIGFAKYRITINRETWEYDLHSYDELFEVDDEPNISDTRPDDYL